ncbi:putative deoxyribonuclease tatdn3 isoform X1 [Astyanax mexicanus]|uniref:Putative deoxyribonuclease tatdn3 isoform X1 n=1 Tax=Astyanax mexicanus TaxID=7994 RepID=A0A8T2MKQ7_ASTMX|nr:putative deoxyribonuclease tatdn3 isoform X1 [Astyanax mexicanus]
MDEPLVDCHCHLSANEFLQDMNDVVERAKQAGVKALIAVTEGASEFESVIQLSKAYQGLIFPCFGIHPLQGCQQDLHSVRIQDLEPVLPLFQVFRGDLVAVGEIGLDFTPWYAPTVQERNEHLLWPFSHLGIRHALLHNFAGRPSVAMEGLQAGYYFSFPPAVSRNDQRDKLIKQIPLERICLETDSPALGPEKQVRNEPKNITISLEHIAKVKGISTEIVAEITTKNALCLFSRLNL